MTHIQLYHTQVIIRNANENSAAQESTPTQAMLVEVIMLAHILRRNMQACKCSKNGQAQPAMLVYLGPGLASGSLQKSNSNRAPES